MILSVIGMMDDGIPQSSSDYALASKKKKNCRTVFKIQMKIFSLYIKSEDGALFNNSSRKPAFVLRTLKAMLNHVINRLSFQQLEYEMERTGLPDGYIFFNQVLWSPCLPLRTYSNLSSH